MDVENPEILRVFDRVSPRWKTSKSCQTKQNQWDMRGTYMDYETPKGLGPGHARPGDISSFQSGEPEVENLKIVLNQTKPVGCERYLHGL